MEKGRVRRRVPAAPACACLVTALLAACGARAVSSSDGGGGGGALQAAFGVTNSVGDAPLMVVFDDDSQGDVTSWSWDFGDGASSHEHAPVHTYTTAATYSVTLTVAGPQGSAVRTRGDLVRVLDGERIGIWTRADELVRLPTSGAAWNSLSAEANRAIGSPNLANQDDDADQVVLAKALVYARTGAPAMRDAVVAACLAAIDTELGGRTLALGRNLVAYVVSADLVGLSAQDDAVFRAWLGRCRTEVLDGKTLVSTHEERPNNWGTHAGASRAAIAAYLGDAAELERCARVFRGWLGDRTAYAGFQWGDGSWQADAARPVGIDPRGAARDGHSLDGVLPDDQRRAGPYAWPPPKENYVWEALQGALAQAVILSRQGYDTWEWSDQALLRAVTWLYGPCAFPAAGDDTWLPHVINHFYAADFPAPVPASPGKNLGWTDWTLQ